MRFPQKSYRLVTPPATEPIATGEASAWLRLDTGCCGSEDEVDQLIAAARCLVESDLERQLVTATWDLYMDRFEPVIELERPPIQSVTWIKYVDGSGVEQTLAADRYKVDIVGEPGRIAPAYGYCWPSARCEMNAVTVRFVAGYSVVDQKALQAIRFLMAHWSINREAVGMVGSEVALAYRSCINSLRWH